MLFAPKCIGSSALDAETLAADKKSCRRIGPCGVGARAVYLNSFYVDRRYYVCYGDVARIFKRVAMSRGGFTGKGVFGSIPYLVVQLRDGREKQCNFKYEEQVDQLLAAVAREHPNIPTHSEEAERKLREAEEAERARYLDTLSPEAEEAVASLRAAKARLEANRALSDELSAAARQKRVIDGVSPTYRYAALAILLLAAAAAGLGIHMWRNDRSGAELVTLFGFAAIFFIISTRVLPTGRNNRSYANRRWAEAVAAMRDALRGETDFPVPPQYAHPVVLERMIRVLREGRAATAPEAYAVMKADLRALNADVTVTQKEYDEVVTVKPMFLVCGYADETEKS